ncbi:MAG: tyrosine-type recombinase/integrase [Gemmataceae bacterium]
MVKNWVYLGPWGSVEADAKFRKLAAEYLSNPYSLVRRSDELTISTLLHSYLQHLEKNESSLNTRDLANRACLSLIAYYGTESALAFGPSQFATWAQSLMEPDKKNGRPRSLCQQTIKQYTRAIIRAFCWGVTADLIKTNESRLPDLERMNPLYLCQNARKPQKRDPAESEDIAAVLAELTPTLQAAVRLQCLTGMRSGEMLSMRPMDLRKSGLVHLESKKVIDIDRETEKARERGEIGPDESIWIYVPNSHKTEKLGHFRAIPILPAAQKVLESLPSRPATMPFITPRESVEQRMIQLRAQRKTKVQPSQVSRKKIRPLKTAGDRYTPQVYCKAVKGACDRAGINAWTPHCLRHAAGSTIADEEGNIRGSQAMLGHASPRTTEGYTRKISFQTAISAASTLERATAG